MRDASVSYAPRFETTSSLRSAQRHMEALTRCMCQRNMHLLHAAREHILGDAMAEEVGQALCGALCGVAFLCACWHPHNSHLKENSRKYVCEVQPFRHMSEMPFATAVNSASPKVKEMLDWSLLSNGLCDCPQPPLHAQSARTNILNPTAFGPHSGHSMFAPSDKSLTLQCSGASLCVRTV